MNRRIVGMVVLALVVAGCGSDDGDDGDVSASSTPPTLATIPVTEPPDVPDELIGSWRVVSAGAVDAPEGVTVTISAGGGLTGFLGCNELFGSMSTADAAVRFVNLSYSEIGCDGVEDFVALVEALERVEAVEADDSSATLSSAEGPEVVLERADDAAPA